MIIVARRVLSASVAVDDKIVSSINKGLLLYVGLSVEDSEKECQYYARKAANLRIFESHDEQNTSEKSIKDIQGQILSVSQFTLSADTKKGNRPSFAKAMPSKEALPLFNYFNKCLEKEANLEVLTGIFGADMKVSAIDDGPFTIVLKYEMNLST